MNLKGGERKNIEEERKRGLGLKRGRREVAEESYKGGTMLATMLQQASACDTVAPARPSAPVPGLESAPVQVPAPVQLPAPASCLDPV